jgi:DAK2 domain fusion protein YloV
VTTPPPTLSSEMVPAGPILACDGQGLKALAAAGLAWLEQNQQAVNALNVFPVPDGDTGTNMLLTMRSAYKEVAHSPEHSAAKVAHALAHGALMGARGNSGVILSQLWRGFARGIDGVGAFTARQMATGLEQAAETAYKGVVKPVEGTILTVGREAAEEARLAAADSHDLRVVLERIVKRAYTSVAHTPELLPILKEAGVVDSGGQGLAVILEGMLRFLRGEPLALSTQPGAESALQSSLDPGELGYGYDVQFILSGENLDVAGVRRDIDAMGDSTLVVGDSAHIKVHVHVHDPGVPISYGIKLGVISDVVVENMQEQYKQFVMERLAAEPAPLQLAQLRPEQVGTVVVAAGDGLARVFASLGVAVLVPGGQTMNPSTEDILRAVEDLPCRQVIVLPNNKNIVLAARQAAELSQRHRVTVIPTRNVPQGIAAMLAYNAAASLEENAARMQAVIENVQCGEITTATRTVEIDGVSVAEGQIIGLHNGRLALAGNDLNTIVEATLDQMGAAGREIITLYYGDTVRAEDALALAERLRARFDGQEIEVVEGRQPHYHYILSTE